jgi:hypothetical protein
VQGGGLLERADLLVLRIIADSSPDRPLYISRTAGDYAWRLGLGNNALSQGLARKIVPAPVASRDTVFVAGSGWLDVPRSRALWREFEGPSAIVRRNDWIDQPSMNTAFSYLLAGEELAAALDGRGEREAADSVSGALRAVARAVRLEHLLVDAMPSRPVVPPGDTGR